MNMKKFYVLFLLIGSFLGTANAQVWQMQNVGYSVAAAYPADIDIVDANVVWTATSQIGDGSGVAVQLWSRTIDGGLNWTSGSFTADTAYKVSNISAIDSNTCYIVTYNNVSSEDGLLFRTTDGGTTWDTIATSQIYAAAVGTFPFPNIVHFFDAANGMTMGDPRNGYYEIYTTTDSGATWTRVPSANIPAPLNASEYGLVNVYGANGDFIYFGTNNGRIFRSYDRGLNWVATTMGTASTANGVTGVTFRDSLNGFAQRATATPVYTNYRTTNGGATWTVVSPVGTMFRSDFMYVPGTSVMISVGANGNGRGSSQSINDGSNWVTLDTNGLGTTDGYVSVDFLDSITGWAGGFAFDPLTDGIYRWAGGTVGIGETTADQTSLNAYPNPSRDIVFLETSKTFKFNVTMSIVDVLGNVISEQTFARWSNPTTLNVSNLSQGVYFVRIRSGNEVMVKRIVRN